MTERLSRHQRARLEAEGDDWTRRDSEWRAGLVFLRLEDRGLVEWKPYYGGDVSCGPGAHGGGWLTRRTDKGRSALGLPGAPRP